MRLLLLSVSVFSTGCGDVSHVRTPRPVLSSMPNHNIRVPKADVVCAADIGQAVCSPCVAESRVDVPAMTNAAHPSTVQHSADSNSSRVAAKNAVLNLSMEVSAAHASLRDNVPLQPIRVSVRRSKRGKFLRSWPRVLPSLGVVLIHFPYAGQHMVRNAQRAVV